MTNNDFTSSANGYVAQLESAALDHILKVVVMEKKYKKLYHAVNDAMAHLGAYGEIDSKNKYIDAVMTALYEIDGGNVMLRDEG